MDASRMWLQLTEDRALRSGRRAASVLAVLIGFLSLLEPRHPASAQSELDIVPDDVIGGATWSVAHSGGRVVAGSGTRLRVFAASNVAEPLGASDSLPGIVRSVTVSGTLAAVATGPRAGLQLVDVEDPAAPRRLSGLATPGSAEDVALMGGLALVADGADGGVRVVRIIEPSAPVELAALTTPGAARRIDVSGSIAVIADGSPGDPSTGTPPLPGGLEVIDLSDPEGPVQVGRLELEGIAYDVVVGADPPRAWAAVHVAATADRSAEQRLVAVDLSRPDAPRVAGRLTVGTGEAPSAAVRSMLRIGRYLIIVSDRIRVIDTRVLGSPTLIRSIAGDGYGLAASGDRLWVGLGVHPTGGVAAYRIGAGMALYPEEVMRWPGDVIGLIAMAGAPPQVVDRGGLWTLDAADPSDPIGHYRALGTVRSASRRSVSIPGSGAGDGDVDGALAVLSVEGPDGEHHLDVVDLPRGRPARGIGAWRGGLTPASPAWAGSGDDLTALLLESSAVVADPAMVPLRAVALGDPTRPHIASVVPGIIGEDIAADAGHALVATTPPLLLDVSDPSRPTVIATMEGGASHVALDGGRFALADGTSLRLGTIEGGRIRMTAETMVDATVTSLSLDGQRLVVGLEGAAGRIFALDADARPLATARFETVGTVHAVAWSSNALSVAVGPSGMVRYTVLDGDGVESAEAPHHNAADSLRSVKRTGGGRLGRVQSNGPAAPASMMPTVDETERGAVWSVIGGQIRGMATDDGSLYVGQGIRVAALAPKRSEAGSGRLAPTGHSAPLPGPIADLDARDGILAVAVERVGVWTMAVTGTQRARPAMLGWLDDPGAEAVAIGDGVLVVAGGTPGRLLVVDATDPRALRAAAEVRVVGRPRDVVIRGRRAFVADSERGLRIWDVSDPFHPVEQAILETPGAPSGVAVHGERVIVADGPGGLLVVDAAEPSAPRVLGRLPQPGQPPLGPHGTAEAVTFADASALAVVSGSFPPFDGMAGIRMVDISDPERPRLIGELSWHGEPDAVVAVENRAYAAAGSGGIYELDITMPGPPVVTARHRTWGMVESVAAADDAWWIADGRDGLRSVPVAGPKDGRSGASLPLVARDVVATSSGAWTVLGTEGGPIGRTWTFSEDRLGAAGWLRLPADAVLAADERGAVVASPQPDVAVIGAENPASPLRLLDLQLPGVGADVALAEGGLWLAAGDAGVLGMRRPEPGRSPAVREGLVDGRVQRVAARGALGYVLDVAGTLHVLEGASPLTARIAGRLEGVAADGSALTAASRTVPSGDSGERNGVWIVDGDVVSHVEVTRPQTPTLGFRIPSPSSSGIRDLAALGDRVMMAAGPSGVFVVRPPPETDGRPIHLPIAHRR